MQVGWGLGWDAGLRARGALAEWYHRWALHCLTVSADVVACVPRVKFCARVYMLSFRVWMQLKGEGGGVHCCFGKSLHVMCQEVESDTLLW
jgi:hypothetical protein